MHKYVIKRLLFVIPTILVVTFIVYSIMELTPSSPGRAILGPQATQEQVDMLNADIGYDKPFFTRYINYILNALQGDFGISYKTRRPVFAEIFARFPTTLRLALMGVIGSALIGIPLGVLSAVKQYSIVDAISTFSALLLAAIPVFWFGMMLVLLFSLKLGWLPASGIGSWRHYVLPAVTLFLPGAAVILRMTRTTMLETIRQDYVRTAKAKGASRKRIIWYHSLKNALLPVITNLGMSFGFMLGGAVLTEAVFALPGLGTFIVSSIRSKDITIVMGSIVFLALLFCFILLVVDLIYAFLDPRIKAQYSK